MGQGSGHLEYQDQPNDMKQKKNTGINHQDRGQIALIRKGMFKMSTLEQFQKRLPRIPPHKVRKFEGTFREKLVQLHDHIDRDRCDIKVRDKTKCKGSISADTGEAINTQEKTSNATKFNGWSLLCKGTGRTLPNTNDIFHSCNYAIKSRGLTIQGNQYNRRCKICKFLENSGTPKKDLHKDHLGNLPFHFLQ